MPQDSENRWLKQGFLSGLLVVLGVLVAVDRQRESRELPEQPPVTSDLSVESTPAPFPTVSELENEVSLSLRGGETRDWTLDLATQTFIQIEVQQAGIDVVAVLLGPDGDEFLVVDSPNGRWGLETFLFVTQVKGVYRVRLQAADAAKSGKVRIDVVARRPGSSHDRERAEAWRLFNEAEHLRRQRNDAATSLAIETYHRALAQWEELGDVPWQAKAYERLSQLYRRRHQPQTALQYLEEAQGRLLDPPGNEDTLAWILNRMGALRVQMGHLEEAHGDYSQALALSRASGNAPRQAALLNNIALIDRRQGRLYGALHGFQGSLAIWRGLGSRVEGEAQTLANIGDLYARLGRPSRAREYLEQSRVSWKSLGRADQEGAVLGKLGNVERAAGNLSAARNHLQTALRLHQQSGGGGRTQARLLNDLGLVWSALGDAGQARQLFDDAMTIYARLGQHREANKVLLNLGWSQDRQQAHSEAQTTFQQVLEKASVQLEVAASAHFGLAKAYRAQRRLVRAQQHIEQSLRLLEDLRHSARSQVIQASYVHTKFNYYRFYIDLLVARHEIEPEAGFDRRALQAVEHVRSRSMVERLTEARSSVSRQEGTQLRLAAIREEIARLERQLLAAQRRDDSSVEQQIAKGLSARLLERDQLAGEERPSDRPRAPDGSGTPASVNWMQQELDDDMALLVYALGSERGFVWWLTRDQLQLLYLPATQVIEDVAHDVYRLLQRRLDSRDQLRLELALIKLSRLLLDPVVDRLQGQRLVIMADGALRYVPFAALPKIQSERRGRRLEPLIVHHEVSRIPSMSLLIEIRERAAGRSQPKGQLAILADPIFERNDPRLDRRPAPRNLGQTLEAPALPSLRRAGAEVGLLSFQRLHGSLEEARALEALADPGASLVATGFSASRDLVLQGALKDYRMLHFATHGLVNPRDPELSGLVLSLLDEQGSERDGFLRVQEILHLDLPADLVVLSACRTALGEQLRGEGIMGVSQGFLVAGASRVVVSLWDIEDRATAELMTLFYGAMLTAQRTPSAALRHAQIELWHQDRWQGVSQWSSFELAGDWR